jgi:hypothetical protein
MFDFLDRARELYTANRVNPYSSDLDRVFRAISKLQAVHSKSELDLVNLESVFSAFEMAELLDVSPSEPGLVLSMNRLIAWTLDEATLFEVNSGRIVSSSVYERFAALIRKLSLEDPNSSRCAVITFNYDLALDMALHGQGLNPDYGLSSFSDPPAGAVDLLKLHGSIGWRKCSADLCGTVVPEVIPRLDRFAQTAKMKWSQLRKTLNASARHCDSNIDGECVIVPPSWNKTEMPGLVNVWKRAAAALKTATTIIVCGYSLPETDSFFRYLYGLGAVGETLLERFWVFDPSTEAHERFLSLLGPGARGRFKSRTWTFDRAAGVLESVLVNRSRLPD